ncbi:hypothetical protein JOD02_001442 [Caldicoprobacter guelmensis]|uniref:anti-sigma factor family protein n=1 Tax=Caldicoprobacter guelmensis TaxID=1170224 RepID=UPI00195B1211|nr:zf-HC2 domain-containing protein [Caldicoprobacter guelmensis]MBM7582585.1 hypothetical protein [Caldicoprobacter guelmensis]
MDCGVVQELISLYIDGELDKERAQQLEGHIEDCIDCRRKFERMKAAVQMVRRLEEEELPVGFVDRLCARLENGQVTGVTYKNYGKFSRWIKWVGIAAAAIVIVLAIKVLSVDGFLFGYSREKGQSDLAAPQDMSKSSVEDSAVQESTESSNSTATRVEVQQRLGKGDASASDAEPETQAQLRQAEGYIKSDKVRLKVQEVCVTPQTVLIRALQHGIDMVDQTEDSITLKVTSIEQRKALYKELELLGEVEEVGTNFESDTVTIVIVEQE